MSEWYYSDGTEQMGPVPTAEIERMRASGELSDTSLVWRAGLPEWVPLESQFPTVSDGADTPPPPPAGSDTRILPQDDDVPAPRRAAVPDAAPPPAADPEPWVNPPPRDAPEPHQAAPTVNLGADGLYVGAPSRGFGEAISVCLSKYVGFSGRASRSEYWFFVLFCFLVGVVTGIVDVLVFPLVAASPLNALASLALFLPSLAVTWRRLHDTERSGWWVGGFYLAFIAFSLILGVIFASGVDADNPALAILPLLALLVVPYAITILVFMCLRGTLGPNRYG